jgi:hypothetical protein
VPRAAGGIATQPVSGREALLGPEEVRQLIDFAAAIPKQFPQTGSDGTPVAADVEFAFVGGRLWLLQIRPFNESAPRARPDRDGPAARRRLDRQIAPEPCHDGMCVRAGLPRRWAAGAVCLLWASGLVVRMDIRNRLRRLEGNRQRQAVSRCPAAAGALLKQGEVDLRLAGQHFDLPPVDPGFSQQVAALLQGGMDDYGLAVLDLSDPSRPRYAEHRAEHRQNIGSVGKLVVVLALFQGLADLHPADLPARLKALKTTVVTADGFSQSDHHTVRIFDPATRQLKRRAVARRPRHAVQWLDGCSPELQRRTGMVMRKHAAAPLRRAYPPSRPRSGGSSSPHPKGGTERPVRKDLLRAGDPQRASLDALAPGQLLHRRGKQRVPGGESYGTARELMRYLLRMEQGRLVDPFSSREIKRLIYVTERRIRYASSPALAEAAVYFKSGSLFQCAPEAGFTCRPYAGNVKNFMNSATIVESPAQGRQTYYMSTLVTNILRKNSAAEHQALAARIQQLLKGAKP